jgi:hypothetical protein
LADPTTWLNEDCIRKYFIDRDVNNTVLTPAGCNAFCGNKQGWYSDPGPRVVNWVIPIFFLLSNIDLSPIDRKKFFAIFHAIGDPIDTNWSLLDKLYAWYGCYHVAKKIVHEWQLEKQHSESETTVSSRSGNGAEEVHGDGEQHELQEFDRHNDEERVHVANGAESSLADDDDDEDEAEDGEVEIEHRIRIISTVFAGFEEISGHYLESGEQFYRTIAQTLGAVAQPGDDQHVNAFRHWREAAVTMADDRTNEFLRTGLAIALYIFQVVSEFVDKISGDGASTPGGGRIGSAIFLSWLIPTTLLSNLLGGFTSRRTCLESMVRLVEATNLTAKNPELVRGISLIPEGDWEDYFDRLPSLGAMYTFRSFKWRHMMRSTGWDKAVRLTLPAVAFLPVVFGFVPAFYIHWKAVPQGFSCRHFWILGVFSTWMLSAVLTTASEWWLRRAGRETWHFGFVFVKDVLVGVGSILIVFFSVVGAFNSCRCWSLSFWLGERLFPLNSAKQYQQHKRSDYAIMVGIFLGLQLLLVVVVLVLLWEGLTVMRWGERRKRYEWQIMMGEWRLAANNLFLFWTMPTDGSRPA